MSDTVQKIIIVCVVIGLCLIAAIKGNQADAQVSIENMPRLIFEIEIRASEDLVSPQLGTNYGWTVRARVPAGYSGTAAARQSYEIEQFLREKYRTPPKQAEKNNEPGRHPPGA